MHRLGRPIVAIFVAYALLLAPIVGALAASRMADRHFELCAVSAADRGAPADTVEHKLCCVLGACVSAMPGLASGTAAANMALAVASIVVAARGVTLDRIAEPLAAPPRGPPAPA